ASIPAVVAECARNVGSDQWRRCVKNDSRRGFGGRLHRFRITDQISRGGEEGIRVPRNTREERGGGRRALLPRGKRAAVIGSVDGVVLNAYAHVGTRPGDGERWRELGRGEGVDVAGRLSVVYGVA